MSISAELEATILRYYHVEKWRVGTIARQLRFIMERCNGCCVAPACRRRNALRVPPKLTHTCRSSSKHWSAIQR